MKKSKKTKKKKVKASKKKASKAKGSKKKPAAKAKKAAKKKTVKKKVAAKKAKVVKKATVAPKAKPAPKPAAKMPMKETKVANPVPPYEDETMHHSPEIPVRSSDEHAHSEEEHLPIEDFKGFDEPTTPEHDEEDDF